MYYNQALAVIEGTHVLETGRITIQDRNPKVRATYFGED